MAMQVEAARAPRSFVPRINIYDVSAGEPVRLTSEQVQRDVSARQALRSTEQSLAWMNQHLGFRGFGSAKLPVKVGVHADPATNAYFDVERGMLMLGDGDRTYSRFTTPDLVTHELVHAAMSLVGGDRPGGDNEHAAVRESIANVVAAVATGRDWKIGTGVTRGGLFDLAKPPFEHVSNLPRWANGSFEPLDPHDLSGLPSLVAVRATKVLGREAVAGIWFDAGMRDGGPGSSLDEFASTTLTTAKRAGGETAFNAIKDAWNSVGIVAH